MVRSNVAEAARSERVPSIYDICSKIAGMRGDAKKPLDESHPMWPRYFAYSEWFRHRICGQFGFPFSTDWETIYRRVGIFNGGGGHLTEEGYRRAVEFGTTHIILDDVTRAMFSELEKIERQIVTGRL